MALAATRAHRITLWTALDHAHPLFLELADRHGIELRAQPGGSLGERMHRALADQPGPGLLIGTDCPELTPTLLQHCYRALADAEAVCLPAEDGGYGLIGVRRSDPELADQGCWVRATPQPPSNRAERRLRLPPSLRRLPPCPTCVGPWRACYPAGTGRHRHGSRHWPS